MDNTILNVSIDLLIPNRFQPRLVFDEKALNELADSIKEHGIIEPIIVRPLNDKYEIIAGERRYKAACIAGLNKVPVIVKHLSDYKSAQVAVIENVQRRNLNPIEEAKSYKRILEQGLKTQEELAKEIGVSQSTIANKLRLLSLAEPVKQALNENKISERHARSILKITSLEKQEEILNKVINERLTVKDLDEEIKKLDTPNLSFKIPDVPNLKDTIDLFDLNLPKDPLNDNKSEIFIKQEEPEPLTIEPKEETKTTNIFDIPFLGKESKPDYPSLEDLETNMDIGIENEILVPKKQEEPEPIIEVTEPILVQENQIEEKKSRIISNDLSSIKKAIEELKIEIKEAGFNIELEDYDFSDLYQVIIKINK